MNRLTAVITTGLLVAVLSVPSWATNGMYMAGYGAETIGRGGANLAVADRALALNFNPAGITQLQGNHYTVNFSVLAPELHFKNMVNASLDGKDDYFAMPAFGYVRSGKETPWSFGVGFIGQGGMGATFDDQNTFFGTRDGTYSEVRFATLSPTVAYAFGEDMAVGLALNLGYADASFRFFPETSFFNQQAPEMSFFGVNLLRAGGVQYNLRAGWWWRPHPRFSIGAIYQTETEAQFEGGDMWINFRSHPMLGDKVLYDAEIDGFTFAAQAGIGFALRPSSDWIVALDVKRYYWDAALDTITVTGSNPSTPGAPPTVTLPFVFDWEDQWVVALGADYRLSDRVTLRAGYNWGENPVPSRTLTPLFPAITEDHVSVGAGILKGNTVFDIALEHAFETTQVNQNPNPMVNPFGPGAEVSHSQWTLSFGISWANARNR